MSRYIDADETFKHLQKRLLETAYNNVGYTIDADEVYSDVACCRLEVWMHEIHEADVVEVVRCKDCKFRKIEFGWNGKKYKMCANTDYPTDDDAYCSFAERREDDGL